MTEEQVFARRQWCFEKAAHLMQFNGRPDSTAPTVAQVMAAAEALYDWAAGQQV